MPQTAPNGLQNGGTNVNASLVPQGDKPAFLGFAGSLGVADYFARLALKPSFKTGEFWLLVLIVIVSGLLLSQGVPNAQWAATIMTVGGIAYQVLRQDFKDAQHAQIVELLPPVAEVGPLRPEAEAKGTAVPEVPSK